MNLPPINSDVIAHGRKVEVLDVDDIELHDRARPVTDEAVETLSSSLEKLGLRTPISVRYYADRPAHFPQGSSDDALVLMTGAHRLAAAKRLGWGKIECFVYYEGDEFDVQLWEIAENLHRAALTKAERDDHIRRYAALLTEREGKTAQTASFSEGGAGGPGRGKKGIASKIAEETGVSKDTVRRALNHDRAESERKKAAEKAERGAKQTEFDRQREEAKAGLPSSVQEAQARKEEAIASRKAKAQSPEDRIAALEAEVDELREANAALEVDLAAAKAESAALQDMRVQFEQGGFEKVIAGKDEEIRALLTRVETESRDKAAYKRSSDMWRTRAEEAGWSNDIVIDIDTGEVVDG